MIRKPGPFFAIALFAALAASLSVTPRTASAIPYDGAPDLKLTVDLVTAGTGPNGFDSKVMFANMFGKHAGYEGKRLTSLVGPKPVANFFTLMDFTIADVLRMVKRDGIALPAADTDLSAGRLDEKLYEAGQLQSGRYDVGFMIEHLMPHAYHHELMADLNKHFPAGEVGAFHTALGQAVKDAAAQGGGI